MKLIVNCLFMVHLSMLILCFGVMTAISVVLNVALRWLVRSKRGGVRFHR